MPLSETHCERVSDRGTAYTVLAVEASAEQHPPLKDVGYSGTIVLFTVLTDGGDCVTSHDPYKLVRKMDGNDDWLVDDLKRIGRKAREL